MKRSRVLGAALAAAVRMLGLAPSSGEAGIVRWRDGSPRTPLRAAARGSVRAVGVAGCNHGTRCRRTQSGRFVPRCH